MNQAQTMLENILVVKEIYGVKHYTGVLAIDPAHLFYYCNEKDIFEIFIERYFIKDTTADPILKSNMIEYFRYYARGEGIKKQPNSKVEKELDKLVDSQIIDNQKYYIGYIYSCSRASG